MLAELGGARILMDPWLAGPCQANGWWHLPPSAAMPEALGPIDYITISHVHDDHFHLPTLERLPKTATVIIPYQIDTWMRDAFQGLGFARVIELDHARRTRLPGDIQIENHQFGRIDSAFWLRHADETILNLNDCPTTESWARRWLRNHPSPDIALGAFSYASPFPVCYELIGEQTDRRAEASTTRVLGQFAATMGVLWPRYAVPFATQYAFLLPGQTWMNESIPTPLAALAALAERHPEVSGVLLDPGDSLSIRDGKAASGRRFDWTNRQNEIEAAACTRRPEIERVLEDERAAGDGEYEHFVAYFDRLLSRNWMLRRKIGLKVAFVPEPGEERWQIDCSQARNWISRGVDVQPQVEIRLPRALLFAAVNGELHWETLYLSNRLRVRVAASDLGGEWDFWRMLFNFRDGMLSDRLNFLTPRGRRVLRWRYPDLLRLLRDRLVEQSNRQPYKPFDADRSV